MTIKEMEESELNELLGDCPCGNEIYEGYSHVIIEGEYFCDSVCVYYHWVRQNFDVEEIY
jgi:hypothetical protein